MHKHILYLSLIALTTSILSSEIPLALTINLHNKACSKEFIDSINMMNEILAPRGDIYLKILLRDDQKTINDFLAIQVPLMGSIENLIIALKEEMNLKEADSCQLYPWCTPLTRRVASLPIEKSISIIDAINKNKTINFVFEKDN